MLARAARGEDEMSSLAWLAIPLLVLAVTAAAVTWVSRPRRRHDMHASVKSFHRFRAALSADDRQVGPPHR